LDNASSRSRSRLEHIQHESNRSLREHRSIILDSTLAEYVGTYASNELDVRLAMALRNGHLVLLRRPAGVGVMRPNYMDDFTTAEVAGSVRFTRDRAGKVTGFSIFAGRVLDVRFRKVSADTTL